MISEVGQRFYQLDCVTLPENLFWCVNCTLFCNQIYSVKMSSLYLVERLAFIVRSCTLGRNLEQFKVKLLSSCFVLNLSMPDENFLIFNCYISRAAPGSSFFRLPTRDDESLKTGVTTLLQLLLVIG